MSDIQGFGRRFTAVSAALTFILPVCAPAIEFDGGIVNGNVDTTVSFGAISRVQGRDSSIVCIANGGTAYGCNADDGNLNYDTGMVSQVWKAISDIEVNHESGNMGAFFRVKAFMDTRNNSRTETKRTDLSKKAKQLVGEDVDVLDAYGWFRFNMADRPAEVRLGKHTLNWGESSFISGGINAINPMDFSALRAPGMELREALLPVTMVSGSVDPTNNLSVEGFYQLEWDQMMFEPTGSYFNTFDNETALHMGWGFTAENAMSVPRGADNSPDDSGQWGVAMRYFAEGMNSTEFGLYFMNYHSRTPVISGTASAGTPMAPIPPKNYFLEYPEDIQLFGASFNTNLGLWALQGEYSYKHDLPLQIDDAEFLVAGLGPVNAPNQVGTFGANDYVRGYILRDVSQLQATATRIFSDVMWAHQFVFVAEVGLTHVHGMPDKDDLRLEGSGTFASGNPLHRNLGKLSSPITESSDHFPDATSWGYQLIGEWTYANAFMGANLSPHAAFRHDVGGVSPVGWTGNFIEGSKAATVGVTATYKQAWAADISYTSFFGGGRYNLLNDRDYVAFNLKYSF
uniref:DUF1302 domain-containing protein n=1 Tax=Candidatus Kentrum sp. FW TaxID=2126338 RepID=A0A450SXV7_9GAMM|nr:MAG: Protein of unknown function (DUF1302) [Candidatus Kentron sp. FW]VFJ68270.1 MAG: Protein of unknown function (DUF1302) [Candidatus Kentron sp. FW]